LKTLKSLEFDSQEALVNTNGFNLNMNYICGYEEDFKLKNNVETPKEAEEINLERFNSAENITTDEKPIETSESRKEEIIYERIIHNQSRNSEKKVTLVSLQYKKAHSFS
jgi:hypothetical protein